MRRDSHHVAVPRVAERQRRFVLQPGVARGSGLPRVSGQHVPSKLNGGCASSKPSDPLGRGCRCTDQSSVARYATLVRSDGPSLTKCVTCHYELAGHSGVFTCPECGMGYDPQSTVWFSPYTAWHFRTRGPARYLLAAWAVAGMVLAPLSTRATAALAAALIGILALVVVMRARYKKRSYYPYVATTPCGLVVSHTGRPGSFEIISWSLVSQRLRDGPRPWRWGTDMARDLKVHLPLYSSRALFAEACKRVDDQVGSRP